MDESYCIWNEPTANIQRNEMYEFFFAILHLFQQILTRVKILPNALYLKTVCNADINRKFNLNSLIMIIFSIGLSFLLFTFN